MKSRRRRFGSLISTWTSFFTVFFIFYILGDLIAGWWHNEIWVWIILGFSLLTALSTTFRFFVYRGSSVSEHHEDRYYTDDFQETETHQDYIEPQPEPITPLKTETTKETYCQYCGTLVESGARFCANCGASV